jgi:hypothetical protein
VQSFDQGSASGSASGSHRTIGSVSVQSIEALNAVLIVHRQIPGRYRVLPALLLNGPIRIFRAGHGKSLLAQ